MRHLKIYILLLAIFLTVACSNKQKSDCSKFKNGSFSLYSEITNTTLIINRNDSFQTETEKETNKVTEWKVTWINDCEYNLLLTNDNFGLLKSGQLKTIPTFNYQIISTGDKYYIFKTQFSKSHPFVTDTIWKTDL